MSAPATNSALDKRRTKWVAAGQAVTEAQRALAAVDQQLEANARLRDAAKAELRAAALRRKELDKQLKSLAKQRDALRTDRTDAKREVKKSRRSVKLTEAKFDDALLKDMLLKAKSADLTANATAAAPERNHVATDAPVPTTSTPARATRAPQRRTASTASRRRASAVAPSTPRAATTNGRSAPN